VTTEHWAGTIPIKRVSRIKKPDLIGKDTSGLPDGIFPNPLAGTDRLAAATADLPAFDGRMN